MQNRIHGHHSKKQMKSLAVAYVHAKRLLHEKHGLSHKQHEPGMADDSKKHHHHHTYRKSKRDHKRKVIESNKNLANFVLDAQAYLIDFNLTKFEFWEIPE